MHTIKKLIFALIAFTVLGLAPAAPALADSDADIAHRKTVMKAVGGTMKGLAMIVKKQAPAKNADALSHAMFQLSKVVPDLFPEGSDFGETGARPEIWSKPAEFKAAVMAYQRAARHLSTVVHSGDMGAFAKAFGAMGKTCGGCHKPFRVKKK